MECPQPEYLFPTGPFNVVGSKNIYRHSDKGHGINAFGEILADRKTVEFLLEHGVVYTDVRDYHKRIAFDHAQAAPFIKPVWMRQMEDESKATGRKMQQRSAHEGDWSYEIIDSDWTKEKPENFRLEPLPKTVKHVIAGVEYTYPEPLEKNMPNCYRILVLNGDLRVEQVNGYAYPCNNLLQATKEGANRQLAAMKAFLSVRAE